MARRLTVLAALLVFAGGIAAAVIVTDRGSPAAQEQGAPTATKQQARPLRLPLRRLRGPHNGSVPILMYHVLGRAPTGAIYPQLFVPPAELAAQTDWLTLPTGAALPPLPPKPIVLSFDDGYLSDYTVALPTLRRRGWPGVLDLAVRNLTRGDIEPWQVRRLIAAGWEIAAHTISHVDLTTLDSAELRGEVAGSRAELQRLFGKPVQFFCYPLGRYDSRVLAAVKAAGFLGATTENRGLARPAEPFTLDRIGIEPSDGVPGLVQKLGRYTR
jgi:hypothetical protein